jgi:hypothetical protein
MSRSSVILEEPMPVYEIELYELHAQKFRITATSEARAIKKLLDGGGDAVDNGLDYIEVCDSFGLLAEEFPVLAEELRSLGVSVDEEISGVRSIEQVE